MTTTMMATTMAPTDPPTVCIDLSPPTEGTVSYSPEGSMDSRLVGTTATFSCNDGYGASEGSTTRVCQSTGEWNGTSLVCGQCLNI